MRRGRIVFALLALILVFSFSLVYANDVDHPVDMIEVDHVICDRGCGGMAYLVCGHNWIYDGTSTHNSGKCKVRYYFCNYSYYKCDVCGHTQSMSSLNCGSGYHFCHEIHSQCGRGSISYCQEGTYGI